MMTKKRKILIYFFIWYPFLGFFMGWSQTLYYYNLLNGFPLEKYSIMRMNNAILNGLLNVFRLFSFKISLFSINKTFSNNNLISILFFFIGVLILILVNHYGKIFYKFKLLSKRKFYFYLLLFLLLVCLYLLLIFGILSPMILEGYLFAIIFLLFYKLNMYILSD